MALHLGSTVINGADLELSEVDRLITLGATWARTSGDPDDDVLRDPEGNEFCVCRGG